VSAPDPIAAFWARRCAALPAGVAPPHFVEAFSFGAGEMADRLLALALVGTKTATTMPLWEREARGQPLWQIGDESIVLDGSGVPRCVMATTELRIVPFDAIDAPFVREYGEGDRTMAWFQSDAWDYYAAVVAGLGRPPARDMPMICERFRLIYRE
jgi:uncharacterized protein YhfF